MADTGVPTSRDPALAAAGNAADWPVQAADTIERVVGSVRDKTTGPALTVARAIVYGLLGAILGLTALTLFTVGLLRLVNAYLPDALFGRHHMWAAHLVVGLVFCFVGLLLWSRRSKRPAS
jgi:hypothetical protein